MNGARALYGYGSQGPDELDEMFGRKSLIPGGGYTAVENADGTWNILGIPFFASHEMLEDEGGHVVDREWQLEAVANHLRNFEKDGYLAPLIEQHHGDAGGVDFLAFFLPKRVELVRLEDREVDASFVDLLYLEPHVYSRYRRCALPYLSSEFSFPAREHVQLSALDHRAPWFRFPLITIGKEIRHSEAGALQGYPDKVPETAIRGAKDRVLALRSRGVSVMANDPKNTTAPGAGAPDPARRDSPAPGAAPGSAVPPAMPAADPMAMMNAKLDQVIALLTRMAGGAGAAAAPRADAPGDDKNETGKPAEQRADKDPLAGTKPAEPAKPAIPAAEAAPAAQAPAATVTLDELSKRSIQQQVEIDRLKAADRARQEAEKSDGIVVEAMKDLKLAHADTPEAELTLRAYLKDPKLGKGAVAAYVDAAKRHAASAPPANLEEFTKHNGGIETDPDEVKAYESAGADVVARARHHARNYRYAVNRGWKKDGELANYLKANLGVAPAVPAPNKK